MLQDIATMTGGHVISEKTGIKFENATLEMLGRARKVIATKDSTVVVGGKGAKKDIDARVAQIRTQIADTTSKFDKEKLEERLAKMTGGVAIIRVGAATETEMKYLKMKIEDAVNSTKAAIEEGIVAGGGVAFVRTAQKLVESVEEKKKKLTPGELVGYMILLDALEKPLRQIAENAGVDGGVVVDRVKNGKDNIGYDAITNTFPDVIKAGIIDPVKVARTGLERAASAAAMLLTTEAAVAEEPEEKKDIPMPGGEMGGLDY
jgi:chaperonin GroEL